MYNDLLGIPFVGNGRDKHGFDCYGLATEVYRRHGIELPEYTADYKDDKAVNAVMTGALVRWRRLTEPKVPCLVVMRFTSSVVNHVGVYIGHGRFIHARQRIGVAIERVDSPAWRKLIEGYYEYNSDSYESL